MESRCNESVLRHAKAGRSIVPSGRLDSLANWQKVLAKSRGKKAVFFGLRIDQKIYPKILNRSRVFLVLRSTTGKKSVTFDWKHG